MGKEDGRDRLESDGPGLVVQVDPVESSQHMVERLRTRAGRPLGPKDRQRAQRRFPDMLPRGCVVEFPQIVLARFG